MWVVKGERTEGGRRGAGGRGRGRYKNSKSSIEMYGEICSALFSEGTGNSDFLYILDAHFCWESNDV